MPLYPDTSLITLYLIIFETTFRISGIRVRETQPEPSFGGPEFVIVSQNTRCVRAWRVTVYWRGDFVTVSYSNQRLLRSGLQSATSDVEDATASDEVDRPETGRGRSGTDAWSSDGERSRRGWDSPSSRSARSVSTAGGGDGVRGGWRTEVPRRETASTGGGGSYSQTAGE